MGHDYSWFCSAIIRLAYMANFTVHLDERLSTGQIIALDKYASKVQVALDIYPYSLRKVFEATKV